MTGKLLLAPLLALAFTPAALAAVFNVNFESMTVPGNIVVDATPDPEPTVNTLPNLSTNWNGTNVGNRVMTGYSDGVGSFGGTSKVGVITDTSTTAGSQLNFEYAGNPSTAGKMVVSFDVMFGATSPSQNMWIQFVNSSGQVIFQMMSAHTNSTQHRVYLFEYDTPNDSTPTQFDCGLQPYSTSQTWRFEIDLTANNAVLKINGVALTANAGAKTSWLIDAATNFGGTRFLTSNTGTRSLAIDNFNQAVEATGLTIFSGGTTTYTIHHDPGAPKCVADAALDLKNVILAATNPDVTVNIVTTSVPTTPMICLGANAAATTAGATVTTAMADGGFRIKTVGNNLYILGADTPQGQKTTLGGFLRGTRDGVSYLWETYLNARYLLPGPDGLDVPITTSMVVPAQDTIKLPGFLGRDFDYIGQTPPSGGVDPATPNEVDKWMQRNRVGKAIDVDRGHTWSDYPSSSPGSLQAAWMAISVNNGVNRDATTTVPRKYCTTNTSLQDAYAVKLNSVLNTETTRTSVSMSPTDGIGGCYCTAPNCKAHITIGATPVDYQGFGITRTRQILKWYSDVGSKFFTSYPAHANKRLGGYIYNEYNLPPTGTAISLHPNIELYYAPRHWYGQMLFKASALTQFQTDLAAWAALYPNQLSYSDYPMWGNYPYSGTPISPGLTQLDTVIAALDSANARHLIFNSNSAWGWVGLKHYCLARKMWDPTLSMSALKSEYLSRCYGDGASDMQFIYDLLDSTWDNYIDTRPQTPNIPDWMTDLTDAMMAATCGGNWATFESRYFAARTAINNSTHANKAAQLNRLKMFGKNLAVLHYRLRHKGNPGMNTTAYNDGAGNGFYMDDATFTTWRGTNTNDIALEKNWNNSTNGIGTYKDFVYNIHHDETTYAPGTKIAVPTSSTVGGNLFNQAAGFNGTGGAQLWADYKDSVNNGSPTVKNQVVFTCAAGGTVPSASVTVGEHDCAVLGVKEFKAKLWVDSGGSTPANVVNFIFLDQGTNKNVGIFRLNLATNNLEALAYTAPNVSSGAFTTVSAYSRGALIDVKAKIHFDPANPRIEYFVNNAGSTPNLTRTLPKWCEIRKINIAATASTVGKVAMDDVSFGP